jgi:hypothetical protein
MKNMRAVEKFIDAAIALLKPGGALLLGDLPNEDNTKRFRVSEAGKEFETEWRARMKKEESATGDPFGIFSDADTLRTFDDAKILHLLARYRAAGLNAHVLPQPSNLPFGHTREDILITLP